MRLPGARETSAQRLPGILQKAYLSNPSVQACIRRLREQAAPKDKPGHPTGGKGLESGSLPSGGGQVPTGSGGGYQENETGCCSKSVIICMKSRTI